MLAKVIIENGVKKIQALTADTGTGAPVGSYLYLEKKSNPQGYLYCDGSTFDETAYPALYQYLGTNVLPDWREFSAVGAEQNTTNVYDAQTNPNGVIHDHDVYTQGEAKDDQLQRHNHSSDLVNNDGTTRAAGFVFGSPSSIRGGSTYTDGNTGRFGTVTRGKSRAVLIYIKATSGLTENQQENVLNTINENNSYSTEEHPTGKKWIDGKPIYRRVAVIDNNITNYMIVMANMPIDTLISTSGSIVDIDNGNKLPIPFSNIGATQDVSFYFEAPNIRVVFNNITLSKIIAVIEYTKTD